MITELDVTLCGTGTSSGIPIIGCDSFQVNFLLNLVSDDALIESGILHQSCQLDTTHLCRSSNTVSTKVTAQPRRSIKHLSPSQGSPANLCASA